MVNTMRKDMGRNMKNNMEWVNWGDGCYELAVVDASIHNNTAFIIHHIKDGWQVRLRFKCSIIPMDTFSTFKKAKNYVCDLLEDLQIKEK